MARPHIASYLFFAGRIWPRLEVTRRTFKSRKYRLGQSDARCVDQSSWIIAHFGVRRKADAGIVVPRLLHEDVPLETGRKPSHQVATLASTKSVGSAMLPRWGASQSYIEIKVFLNFPSQIVEW